MSSIRNQQQGSQVNAYRDGSARRPQAAFGPAISDGVDQAMLAIQQSFGRIARVSEEAGGACMTRPDWVALEGAVKCGKTLAETRKQARRGSWNRPQWAAQQDGRGEGGLASDDENEARRAFAGSQAAPQQAPAYAGSR